MFYLGGRDRAALESLCVEAEAFGRKAEPWVLDFSGVNRRRGTAGKAGPGSADLIPARLPLKGFAFAAGAAWDGPLVNADLAVYERTQSVNTAFHARLLAALARPGALEPGARGLLVGSLAGLRGRRGQTAYAAAKGALLDLLPLGPPGLRLNVLLPPLLPSPFLDVLSPAARAELFSQRLLDDPDPASSCAEAAHFLLSDRSSYVHRQVLHADSRVTALGWD